MSASDPIRIAQVISICPTSRFGSSAGRAAALAWLVVGIPLGLCRFIAMVLTGAGIRMLCSTPKHGVWQQVLRMLGWQVRWEGIEHYHQAVAAGPTVVAYNHVCLADGPVMLTLPHSMTISGDGASKRPWVDRALFLFGNRWFRFPALTTDNLRGLLQTLDAWRSDPNALAITVAPEGTIGGRAGMFRFERLFFAQNVPVVPVAVSVRAPFGINLYPLSGSMAVSWGLLFVLPWIRIDMRCLAPCLPARGEAPQDFANRVQRVIAEATGGQATDLTRRDKTAARAALAALRTRRRPALTEAGQVPSAA